jgi:aminoglycoside phosphotransferase (APT) family kinase protein
MTIHPVHLQKNDLRSAVNHRLGAIRSTTTVGRAGTTCIVETSEAKVVVKRMEYLRAPTQFADLFARLTQLSSPPCPPLLWTVKLDDHWYAVFDYVEGFVPNPDDPEWGDHWQSALHLLHRLRTLDDIVPPWDLEVIWLERLAQFDFSHPAAQRLLKSLRQASPSGPRTLAHGDFSVQNFLCTSAGLILLDWEEVGSARIGFDAGWILALNRIGAGPRALHARVVQDLVASGFPAANLQWFEALGLLRLLYRTMTLPLDPAVRAAVAETVSAKVSDCVAQTG